MSTDPNAGNAPANATALPISDEQLFRNALEQEVPERTAEPPPETTQPPTSPGERPRDEQGRFVKQPGEQDAPAAPTAPAAAAPDGQTPAPAATPDEPVPSWRHREERERAERYEQRSRQLEALVMEQQRQFALLQQQLQAQQPKAPEPIPDLIADPAGYHNFVLNQIAQHNQKLEQNFSFRMARAAEPELFEQAFGEMISRADRGDPSIAQAVMRSPDPGAAVVNWYRRELTLARVGHDPEAWFEQQLGERLKDQKFAGSLLEKMRGGAQQAQASNGAPAPVQLPPSLNRIAASQPAETVGDMSDSSLFDFAFRQGRSAR